MNPLILSRFNGFLMKPLKRLLIRTVTRFTSLKRGVNERLTIQPNPF